MKKLLPFIILILTFAVYPQSATVITENANLRGTPSESGKVVDTISQGTSMEIIKQKSAWFLVQTTDYVGWVHGNTIRLTDTITTVPTTVYERPATTRQSDSRTYIRGPRGGCYYINRNGNKTYVDRSLCN